MGRGDYTGVVMRMDRYMMYSMMARYQINLGNIAAELTARQWQNPKLGTIFTWPYITHLVRGMCLLDRIRSMERVGSSQPLV